MTFTKLDQIRKHLQLALQDAAAPKVSKAAVAAEHSGDADARVQKNLTILHRDAERLAAFAKSDGLSQARLLSAALDAYENRAAQKPE